MVELAPGVSCATCPVSRLPYPPLSQDLALPCQSTLTAEGPNAVPRTAQPGVCLQGMGEHDPFLVQAPMAWAGLQGVSEHPYTCTSWKTCKLHGRLSRSVSGLRWNPVLATRPRILRLAGPMPSLKLTPGLRMWLENPPALLPRRP